MKDRVFGAIKNWIDGAVPGLAGTQPAWVLWWGLLGVAVFVTWWARGISGNGADHVPLPDASGLADDRAPLMELFAQEADWRGADPARFRASIHARLMLRDARENGWIAFFGRRATPRQGSDTTNRS